jgi:uncharacterized protein GlcG (DUF336 family)
MYLTQFSFHFTAPLKCNQRHTTIHITLLIKPLTMNIISSEAEKVAVAAMAKAQQIGVPINIAIVDEGANLKFFHRMDNAMLGCGDIAIKKAKTSRFFDIASGEIGKLSQPGGPLYNIEHSNGGLITFAGGMVLKNSQGEIIGAIGVSGGSVDEDSEVATAGAAAINL